MTEPEVQVYAWGASGMRNATESRRHPDDGFVKVADYRRMVRMWRQEADDSATALRLAAARLARAADREADETPACPHGGYDYPLL